MAHNSHATGAPEVPPELVAERKAGWHAFTQAIVINSLATVGVLLFLLLVFKVF